VNSSERRAEIIVNSTGGRLPDMCVNNLVAESLSTSTTQAYGDYPQSWALDDFSSRAAQITHEVLIIAGAHDVIPRQFFHDTLGWRRSRTRDCTAWKSPLPAIRLSMTWAPILEGSPDSWHNDTRGFASRR
jgi:hypothetical protein